MDFSARARFVLGIVGFFILIFLIKNLLALNFDPIVYKLQIEGLNHLNPSYLKLKVMPIGGIHLSELTLPYDPLIKSYKFFYLGKGVALLKVKERKVAYVVYAAGKYFLTSKDGFLLIKLQKEELYKATGYEIFFDISPLNLSEDRIINSDVLKDINTVLSYPEWFKKRVLEIDIKKKTLYLTKGISVKLQNFKLTQESEMVILKLVDSSPIGARYLQVGNNFVHLPSQ